MVASKVQPDGTMRPRTKVGYGGDGVFPGQVKGSRPHAQPGSEARMEASVTRLVSVIS